MKIYALCAILLLTVGCSSTTQLGDANRDLVRSTQIYVAGAGDALDREPPAVPLARRLVQDAGRTIGEPNPGDRLDISDILKNDKPLTHQEKQDASALAVQTAAERDLIEKGKLYEAEHHTTFIKRLWAWSIGTLGLGGTIALLCFCPALIPVFLNAAGWIVSTIIQYVPSVVNLMGVVTKKTLDSVVVGIGNAKDHFAQAAISNPTKTFTAQEVQDILGKQLSDSTDAHDKLVVDSVRRQFNV